MKPLTRQEEIELFWRAKAGDDSAKEVLVKRNEGLVYKVALYYFKAIASSGAVDFEDILQNGRIGLLKAIERFDERMGNKFSTYALYWIRQAIMRGLDYTLRFIRIPLHVLETTRAVKHEMQNSGSGFEAAVKTLGLSPSDVEKTRVSLDTESITSLDASLSHENCQDDREDNLHQVLTVPTDRSQSILDKLALRDLVEQAFSVLKPKEQRVFSLLFGIDDGRERTLKEVGEILGITKERVRQIKEAALEKVKDHFSSFLAE